MKDYDMVKDEDGLLEIAAMSDAKSSFTVLSLVHMFVICLNKLNL